MTREELEYLVNLDESRLALLLIVSKQLDSAINKHNPMNSFHEGYAVILEELDELWDEVKLQKPDFVNLRKEAFHVAAMGLRFVFDLTQE